MIWPTQCRRAVVYLSTACLVLVQSSAFADDPSAEGAAAGQAANPTIRSTINTTNAKTNVPGYTATPPQASYYGQTNLSSQANAQLATCVLSTNDPVCEAQLNAINTAQTPLPTVTGSGSSAANASAIAQNPSLTLGDLSVYYAGCTPPAGTNATSAASACPANVICLGTACFNIGYTGDTDFDQSMSMMEGAREAGVYLDTTTMRVFAGQSGSCRQRLLKNCCSSDSSGAGMSNQSMFGTGSHLVYDVLMNSDNRNFVYDGMRAVMSGASFDGTFTSYGVTVAVNGTALPAGSITIASGDSFVIAFDPWSLAIAVVIYIIMSLTSCSQGEGKLSLQEGAGLCHTVGSYCSSCFKILGKCVSCIEHTTGKCCFNSLLARLINEQGRQQLGRGWGSGQSPDCSGFSIPELQTLNFATMDLSAFYSSLAPSMPSTTTMQTINAATATSCYYGQGKCQ